MLLAIDIGNTNIALGLFEGRTLRADWRLETRAARTGDEYAALVATLFGLRGLALTVVDAVASRRWCRRRCSRWSSSAAATWGSTR